MKTAGARYAVAELEPVERRVVPLASDGTNRAAGSWFESSLASRTRDDPTNDPALRACAVYVF